MNPLSKLFESNNLVYVDRSLIIQEFPNPRQTLLEEYGEEGLNQLISNNILYLITNNQHNGVVLNSSIRNDELNHIHEALKNGHKIGKRVADEQIAVYAPMVALKYKSLDVHRFFDTSKYSNEVKGQMSEY